MILTNTKNESNDEAYIINGDMGFVVAADDKKLTCRFTDPERVVGINKKLNNLLLAYAITVHRFQGSEAPVVIIPIHRTASFLQTRAWLYTAISRAKQICITVGERAAIAAAIKKDDSMQRVTRLKELLCVAKSKNN
jgi:exodeoxyribonuclease V alpha subunit